MAWWDDIAKAVGGSSGSGGFDWGTALNIGAQVLGPALGASIANKGANDAADAVTSANQQAIGLQRDIYLDQTARSEPWRQSGFNALNFLNQWNGLPQVQDGTRANSIGSTQLDTMGRPLAAGLGAGQPVAGHSGGGGPSGAASLAGGALGSVLTLGNPLGGMIGSAIGGLVRDGGDNWQTLNTQAPAGYDYEAYMQSPGLMEEWAKPDVQSLFNGNRDAYAYWHAQGGNLNGKQSWAPTPLTKLAGTGDQSTMPVGGTQQESTGTGTATGSGTQDLWSTIRNNPLYVAAQDGFLGVNGQGGDVSAIKGAFANGGQLLSGSTLKALQDRSVSRAGGALSEIYGNYAGMAGVGASTANSQNSNAGQFAANAGNLTAANGQAAGQAAATKNANWGAAAQNGVSGIYDYGKSQGWFGA
jgi:hypothetical protein